MSTDGVASVTVAAGTGISPPLVGQTWVGQCGGLDGGEALPHTSGFLLVLAAPTLGLHHLPDADLPLA